MNCILRNKYVLAILQLYKFANSDVFLDADIRVVYLAGTTISDWIGSYLFGKWVKSENIGLIGALYNYKIVATSIPILDSKLSSKTFSRRVWVVLDKELNMINNFERRQIKFYGSVGAETKGIENICNICFKRSIYGWN